MASKTSVEGFWRAGVSVRNIHFHFCLVNLRRQGLYKSFEDFYEEYGSKQQYGSEVSALSSSCSEAAEIAAVGAITNDAVADDSVTDETVTDDAVTDDAVNDEVFLHCSSDL